VPVHVCPGVTAASAAAASAAISLTLRGVARQLTLVTAHTRGPRPLDLDWPALASDATLAIYMGRAAAAEIARELIAAGRSPTTPVLIAVDVSLPTERIIGGELSSLAFMVEAISDDDPTLLLIGDAVVRRNGSARRSQAHPQPTSAFPR
jgi:uroporphyrin-III C-methyltransferase